MLDKSALSQLKSLKQEIHDSIPRFEGKVRATAGRFGFVVTEDNKQFYLSPDEMEKVLPGDVIAFRVEQVDEKKEQAIIESLIQTDIQEFCGRYLIKGKGHFIEADHPALNRWIFVPPKSRKNAKEGMMVKGHISQHPYPNGRAQADIDICIGMPEDAGVEATFMCHKWGIETEFDASVSELVEALTQQERPAFEDRTDLTALPLITIDSASTRDLDDAVFAEETEAGWRLVIAIADPTAVIPNDSPLDNIASKRTTSVYFANQVVPMLPPELSEQLCSLQPNEIRPALVTEMHIDSNGAVQQSSLLLARVKSHGKLSYQSVSQVLESGSADEIAAELYPTIKALGTCTTALASHRKEHCLVMEERPDYRLLTGDDGKVTGITRQDRNVAQRLVEECMLACNRTAANWLAEQEKGFFVTHSGFRTERIGDVTGLIKEQLALEHKPKIKGLSDFVTLVKQAESAESPLALRSIISRQMDRSRFSSEALPHMGLGFAHYTTMTSPLRKYNDFLLHRIIKSALSGQQTNTSVDEQLKRIQDKQTQVRTAANQAETWLKLDWFSKQDREAVRTAVIQHATSQHLVVRLEEYGIDGIIDRRKAKGKWAFDSKSLSHVKGEERFDIGQSVEVKIQEITPMSRQLRFTLV